MNENNSVSQCGEACCIANLDGKCVFDKCEGALIQLPPCPVKDIELRRRYYYFIRDESASKIRVTRRRA